MKASALSDPLRSARLVSMVRLFVPTVLLLTLLFAAIIALIYIQPRGDSALQSLLFSGDCALPCFMGIRPGITTTQEAFQRLENHPWVAHVRQHLWFSGPDSTLYSWTWSGQQPELINAGSPGMFSTRDNRVDIIQVPTTIPLGAFWLFNRPQQGLIADEPGDISYSAVYLDGALEVQTVMFCPLRLETFWRAQTQLQASIYTRAGPSALQLPGWFHDARCP